MRRVILFGICVYLGMMASCVSTPKRVNTTPPYSPQVVDIDVDVAVTKDGRRVDD